MAQSNLSHKLITLCKEQTRDWSQETKEKWRPEGQSGGYGNTQAKSGGCEAISSSHILDTILTLLMDLMWRQARMLATCLSKQMCTQYDCYGLDLKCLPKVTVKRHGCPTGRSKNPQYMRLNRRKLSHWTNLYRVTRTLFPHSLSLLDLHVTCFYHDELLSLNLKSFTHIATSTNQKTMN